MRCTNLSVFYNNKQLKNSAINQRAMLDFVSFVVEYSLCQIRDETNNVKEPSSVPDVNPVPVHVQLPAPVPSISIEEFDRLKASLDV